MAEPHRTAQRRLVCDAFADGGELSGGGMWVRSPLSCLEKAMETAPDMILIRFPGADDPAREAYLELCGILKRNGRTRNCRVAALVPDGNRTLLDGLYAAGVDHAAPAPGGGLDAGTVRDILGSLRADRWRDAPCPYLRSVAVDAGGTMTVCGAYLDRMVLGGRRLRELCETESHTGCECFQNPRVRP
jgi:hypothetical protein